jgi:5-methylcytosine-specific restriction endonuclease McrA
MTQKERHKLTKANDKMCSELVRRRDFERFKGSCGRCGHAVPSWNKLQWAHLISRSHLKTRWNPDVACGICAGCHMFIDREMDAKQELIDKFIGREKYELLKSAANDTGKVDYQGWNLYLKQELEAL